MIGESNIDKNKNRLEKIKENPIHAFGIVFFFTLAVVFLFNISGIIPWGIWGIFLRLWPVLLIMFLLQLFSRKYKNLEIAVIALGIGMISALVFLALSLKSQKFDAWLSHLMPTVLNLRKSFDIDQGARLSSQVVLKGEDFIGFEERVIKISVDAGTLNLTDNLDNNLFAANSIYYERLGKPAVTTNLNDKTLFINHQTTGTTGLLFGGIEETKYDISVGLPSIPTDLELETGASILNAKLEALNLNTAKIKVGAGTATVTLRRDSLPKKETVIDVGAGSLRLTLPERKYLRIKYFVGLGALKINNLTFRGEGTYTTPNFQITQNPYLINIHLGAGTVLIETAGQD